MDLAIYSSATRVRARHNHKLVTAHHDVQILSDDRIIVREHRVRDENVRNDELCENQLREDATQIFMYGTPWHGEACFAFAGSCSACNGYSFWNTVVAM